MKESAQSSEFMQTANEQSEAVPVTVSYFNNIKDIPDIHPEVEDFSAIFDDIEYRQHCFEEIKKSFLFVYDKDKIDKSMNALANEDDFRYLKQVRRFGLILRESYCLFGSKHVSPEPFYLFIKSLGTFNDQYWFSPREELKKEVAERNIGNFELENPSIENKDFREYAEKLLLDIEELIKEQTLLMNEFHGLRKKIRLYADNMQVSAAENYQGNMHWLFASLLELSVKLGEKHDEYIKQDLNGEIEYEKTKVEVDPYIVENFEKLRPFIEKVMGIK